MPLVPSASSQTVSLASVSSPTTMRVPVQVGVEVCESSRREVVERADDRDAVGCGVSDQLRDAPRFRRVVVEAVVVALTPAGGRDEGVSSSSSATASMVSVRW